MFSAERPVQSVQIFDMSGRMVMRATVGRADAKVDVSMLPAGLYMLRTVGEAGVDSKKFIKR